MEKIKIGLNFLRFLNIHGYQAYLVGGTVRDFLLGIRIEDLDVTTVATPEQVIGLFPDAIPTGIKYGTVTVKFEEQYIEVTTFRSESDYMDYRRPSYIKYSSSLEEDLSRRDFTINALAMDYEGEIIDFHKGQKALEDRIIKTVGTAEERFREDPLRMLRAIRFVAQLGFKIEKESWDQLKNTVIYVRYVSVERIKREFDRMLDSVYVEQAIVDLYESGLLKFITKLSLTNLAGFNGKYLSKIIGRSNNRITRWYLLLHQLNANDFNYLVENFCFTKKERKGLNERFAVYNQLKTDFSEKSLTNSLVYYEKESVEEAIKIFYLLVEPKLIDGSKRKNTNYWLEKLAVIDQQMSVRSVKDLKIDGNELIAELELESGSLIGRIINELFQRVVFQGLLNDKNTLLEEAKVIRGELIE